MPSHFEFYRILSSLNHLSSREIFGDHHQSVTSDAAIKVTKLRIYESTKPQSYKRSRSSKPAVHLNSITTKDACLQQDQLHLEFGGRQRNAALLREVRICGSDRAPQSRRPSDASNTQRAHRCDAGPQPRRTWDWLQSGRSRETLRVCGDRGSDDVAQGQASCCQVYKLPLRIGQQRVVWRRSC